MLKGDFYCETCQQKMKGRLAGDHHKRGHIVWHIDPTTGEMTHRYGTKKPDRIQPVAKKPQITAEEHEHITEHYSGHEKDSEDLVFIFRKATGAIRDMRLEFPLLHPIYQLVRKELEYQGTFPQFLADSVESYFAAAGLEMALAPKEQALVYDEVTRLIGEGKMQVLDTEEGIRLEVRDGNQIQSTEKPCAAHGDQGHAAGEGAGEEDSGESE